MKEIVVRLFIWFKLKTLINNKINLLCKLILLFMGIMNSKYKIRIVIKFSLQPEKLRICFTPRKL